MPLSIIYARTENRCIGHGGGMPWHLPREYASFEKITWGKAIIMGRRSYEDHCTALPNRLNIVMTSKRDYIAATDVKLAHDFKDALSMASDYSQEYFVIGGVNLILGALPLAKTVYETVVDTKIAGDTILPDFDFTGWSTEVIQKQPIDEQHPYSFTVYKHCELN